MSYGYLDRLDARIAYVKAGDWGDEPNKLGVLSGLLAARDMYENLEPVHADDEIWCPACEECSMFTLREVDGNLLASCSNCLRELSVARGVTPCQACGKQTLVETWIGYADQPGAQWLRRPAQDPGESRETLCGNEWVSLMAVRNPEAGVNGYVYSHESRCNGRIVAILPVRDKGYGREYLVKSEMTPCWGFEQVLSAITGGWEGGDIEDDAVREMLEETGYAITRDELISLGESFGTKSTDTVYSLFSVDLTDHVAGEATGDGTRLEAESKALWVDAQTLAALPDPQLALMFIRIPACAA